MVAYRTDEVTAKQMSDDDLIPLAVVISEVDNSSRADSGAKTFRISSNRHTTTPLTISPVPGQRMRELGEGVFEVRRGQEDPAETIAGYPSQTLIPDLGDRDPNATVDFNHRSLLRLSKAFSLGQLTEKESAVELTRAAGETVSQEPEYSGIVSASTTAERGGGDHVALSILLAALLRERGIPSRVAFGVRQTPETVDAAGRSRMVFHAWTLAYVDGDWMELDVTEKGPASANRITFVTTNFSGGDEYDSVAPLMSTIRRIKIERID